MALNDLFKGFPAIEGIPGFEAIEGLAAEGGVTGLALGVGAAILAPIVIPVVAGVAKPLTKAAIKEGIFLYEKSKEAFAEVTEVFEDMVAEAKAEIAQGKSGESKGSADHPEVVTID